MSEWTCKSVGLRIIELPKSVFPAGMAEDIGSYPFFCSSPVVKKINHWLHDGNTILMGTGGVATVHYGQNRFAYSTDTWAFTVADSATNISFLFRQFEHKLKQIEYFGFEGSGLKHLQKEYIRKLELLTPPLNEQNVVVKVLDTIDTAIQQTQAIINKLKQLKQGLLHDLLTRGVDAKGELRPCYEDAPHLYKESPLGWIPKDWEVVTLGEVAQRSLGVLQTGPFGSQLHAYEYVLDGVPVIMPQDMVDGEISVEQIARITQRKASALSRHRLNPNDIVFSRRGDLSRAVAIEEEHTGWLCGTGCLLARFSAREINGFWLALIYQQPCVQSQVIGRAVGSTMPNLNTSILSELTISRPSVVEQDAIIQYLKTATQRIKKEFLQLDKLKNQKTALMDDLLTGRIRITSLLQTEASSA